MKTLSTIAKIYFDRKLLAILALGFSSGLPFLLTLSTLSFRLTEAGIGHTIIGLFMLVSLPYSLKFLWAPFLDQISIPFLTSYFGQRRSWALASQFGLILSLIGLGSVDLQQNILMTAFWASTVAFFSATQDSVIDAYRIEILGFKQNGAGAAVESIGFRLGMLTSGAGALYLATFWGWATAYNLMAVCVLIGTLTILLIPETSVSSAKIVPLRKQRSLFFSKDHWLRTIFWLPWQHFAFKQSLGLILVFIFCFKCADTVLSAMSVPFLHEIGFSKIEFANVSKVFGIGLMVIGGLVGGILINRFGNIQSLTMCASLQAIACLMFVIQSLVGYQFEVLIITVGVESFCSGMTSAVFIAYLSSFCSLSHAACHFTFLYSFGSLCRVCVSAMAGFLADHLGWALLFTLTAITIFPLIVLLNRLSKHQPSQQQSEPLMRWVA